MKYLLFGLLGTLIVVAIAVHDPKTLWWGALQTMLLFWTLLVVWRAAEVALSSLRSAAFHSLTEGYNTYIKYTLEYPDVAEIVFGHKKATNSREHLLATMLSNLILTSFDEWLIQEEKLGAFPADTFQSWRTAIVNAFRDHEFLREAHEASRHAFSRRLGELKEEARATEQHKLVGSS